MRKEETGTASQTAEDEKDGASSHKMLQKALVLVVCIGDTFTLRNLHSKTERVPKWHLLEKPCIVLF